MYIKVIYLSEICNAMGTKIKQCLWNQPIEVESPYHWPVKIPNPHHWNGDAGSKPYNRLSLSLGCNLSLPLPLGNWMTQMEVTYRWYYHPMEMALYHKTPMGCTSHGIFPKRSQTQTFHNKDEEVAHIPLMQELRVASVVVQGSHLVLTSTGNKEDMADETQLSWQEQLKLTTLAKEWQLTIHCTGLDKRFMRQSRQAWPWQYPVDPFKTRVVHVPG